MLRACQRSAQPAGACAGIAEGVAGGLRAVARGQQRVDDMHGQPWLRASRDAREISRSIGSVRHPGECLKLIEATWDSLDGGHLESAFWQLGQTCKHAPRDFMQSRTFSKLVAALEDHILRQGLDHQSLSNILLAMAHLGAKNGELDALQARVMFEVGTRFNEADGKYLANAAWALAKVGQRNNFALNAITRESCRKIETFSLLDVQKTTWAFAKLHLEDGELLVMLASRAFTCGEPFTPQGLANLAWAFGTCRYREAGLVDRLAYETETQLRHLGAQEIANLAWAFAHWARYEPDADEVQRAVQQLCKEASSRQMDSFSPQGLANLAWAAAKGDPGSGSDPAFFHAIAASATRDSLRGFAPQHLANLVWAFATSQVQDRGLFSLVAKAMAAKGRGFTPQGLCNVAWAFASSSTPSNAEGEPWQTISEESAGRVAAFKMQELSSLLWACGKALHCDAALMRPAAAEVVGRLEDHGLGTRGSAAPHELANLAWASAVLGLSPRLLSAIAGRAHEVMPLFKPQELANLAWAYAKARVVDHVLLRSISDAALPKLPSCTPQNMGNLLWALAICGTDGRQEFFSLAGKEFCRRLESSGTQDLSMVAWAFATAHTPAPWLFDAIAAEVRERIQSFPPHELSNFAWACSALAYNDSALLSALAQEAARRPRDFSLEEIENIVAPSTTCSTGAQA